MMQPVRSRARWPWLLPLGTALVAAGVILAAVYPGFMSYDSVRALHEARTGVLGGSYPPFVSYVWRVFDFIWPGPALMLFVQNFVLVLSFALIMRSLGYPGIFIVAGVAAFCYAPPLLGPMLVVWKDVAVSACLGAAVALLLAAEQANPRRSTMAIAAGILMLFFGAAYRLNAIAAVLPLVLWVAWREGFYGTTRVRSIGVGMAVFAGIALAVSIVNRYRFPEFTPLAPNNFFETVMVFDLAGMSAVSGRNLMPVTGQASPPADAAAYLRQIYDPRNINIVAANDIEGRLKLYENMPAPVLHAAFFDAVRREPGAYVEHRSAVFRELIGLVDGATVMSTHPAVDDNEEGVTLRPTVLTADFINYILDTRATTFGKPWFYYVLGTVALAISIFRRRSVSCGVAVAVYSSGGLYLLSFFFITPAADVRYNHWSIVCMFIVAAAACRPAAMRVGAGRAAPA